MDIFVALPNHLRPTLSKKGLKKGRKESPRNYRDRIMITDIGEILIEIAFQKPQSRSIKLVKAYDYYPWRMQLVYGKFALEASSLIFGDSNWQSLVEICPINTKDQGKNKNFIELMKTIEKGLGRKPWESNYWKQENWNNLNKTKGLDQVMIKEQWRKL